MRLQGDSISCIYVGQGKTLIATRYQNMDESLRIGSADPRLRALQLIHFAMAAGVAIFAIVTLALSGSSAAEPLADYRLLTLLNLAFFPTALALGGVMARVLMNSSPLPTGWREAEAGRALEMIWPAIVRSRIVRLAMMEASALFGLVICFMAKGQIRQEPWLLVNTLPAATMIIFVALTFPTASQMSALLRTLRLAR